MVEESEDDEFEPDEDDKDSLVQEARSSLLAHYSSKSSNETAVLLGLSVAFFATIQAYGTFDFPLPWIKVTIFTFILGFIFFLAFRQVGRLVYWGELANAITVVDMLGKGVTRHNLAKIKAELDRTEVEVLKEGKEKKSLKGVDVVSSPILRLSYASSRYVDFYRMKCKESKWNILTQISRLTNNKWFQIGYAIGLFVGYLLIAFACRLFF